MGNDFLSLLVHSTNKAQSVPLSHQDVSLIHR